MMSKGQTTTCPKCEGLGISADHQYGDIGECGGNGFVTITPAPCHRFDPDDSSTWPEDGQRVLVYHDKRWYTTRFEITNPEVKPRPSFSESGLFVPAERVTHWMPVPAPPKP